MSFFARGEGNQVGLAANATFEITIGSVNAGTVTVREQDITNSNRDFAFYQLITSLVPSNVTVIIIQIYIG